MTTTEKAPANDLDPEAQQREAIVNYFLKQSVVIEIQSDQDTFAALPLEMAARDEHMQPPQVGPTF